MTFETNKESSNLEYYEIKKPLMVTREEFGAEVCVSFFNLAEFFIPNSRKLSRRAFSGWATRMHSCQHRLPGVCSPKDNLTRILWGGFLEEDISRRISWGVFFEESILTRDFDKRDIKATLAFVWLHTAQWPLDKGFPMFLHCSGRPEKSPKKCFILHNVSLYDLVN